MALKDWIYKLLGKAGSKAEAEAQPAAETQPEPPVNISGLLINYNGLPFKPEHDEVIYVNGSGDTTVDNLVSANLDALTAAFAARDLRFVYPQELGRCLAARDELWQYYFPDGSAPVRRELPSLPNDYMLRFMTNPGYRDRVSAPALLRVNRVHGDSWVFTRYEFDIKRLGGNPVDTVANIVSTRNLKMDVFYCLHKFRNAEADFDIEVERLMHDVRHRINLLRQAGVSEMVLAELLKPEPEVKLSRLHITADYRIFLPDYGNMEIEMTPLVKTVFFLFLRHPEGIRIKDLIDFRDELWIIYRILKGQYDFPVNCIPATIDLPIEEFIAGPPKSIADLCDITNNSINEKCARIKEAFILRFHEGVARHYFITGGRGEPKRISLPADLIEWETTGATSAEDGENQVAEETP